MNRRRILAAMGGVHMPTARDYVQDGLVAMWDGIENAGWGVHNQTATVWKDLIGTNDISSNGSVFSDDSLVYIPASTKDDIPISDHRPNQPVSFELVLSFGGTPINGAFVQCGSSGTSGVSFGATFYRGNGVQMDMKDLSNVSLPPTNGTATYCVIYDGNIAYRTFKNGTDDVEKITTHPGYWGEVPNGIVIGGWTFRSIETFSVKSIRLYDRALNDAEIAANYAVDKVRFGLT